MTRVFFTLFGAVAESFSSAKAELMRTGPGLYAAARKVKYPDETSQVATVETGNTSDKGSQRVTTAAVVVVDEAPPKISATKIYQSSTANITVLPPNHVLF